MVCAPWCFTTRLNHKSTIQFLPTIPSSTNFHLPISPRYLLAKQSLKFHPNSLPQYLTHFFSHPSFSHTAIATIPPNFFPPTTAIQPFSIRLLQGPNEWGSLVRTDTVLVSHYFSLKTISIKETIHKLGILTYFLCSSPPRCLEILHFYHKICLTLWN